MIRTKELHIKGMVCRRCIRVVTSELQNLGAEVMSVELGKAIIQYSEEELSQEAIQKMLQQNGFELLTSFERKLIEKIKIIIIKLVDELPIVLKVNLSETLAFKTEKDYTFLSKLFSKVEGKTIKKYFIQLKIEKAKELIQDNELNFTEIAYELCYSSVNYLSNQFKHATGMNMTDYKKLAHWNRKPIDKIV